MTLFMYHWNTISKMASLLSIRSIKKFSYAATWYSYLSFMPMDNPYVDFSTKGDIYCAATRHIHSLFNMRSAIWLSYSTERNIHCCLNNWSCSMTSDQNRMSIQDVVEENVKCLEEHFIPEPQESVELFVAHVLGTSTLHGISGKTGLKQSDVKRVKEMVKTRLQRVPIQYILGEWDFCDLTLRMKPPVFIPRPETEELVGFIKSYLLENRLSNSRLLEVGCGSGAITLALLKEYPQLQAVCIDKVKEACDLTRQNASELELSHRLDVIHRDITEDMSEMGFFDLIVSNPPYISTDDMESLDPQVTRYEDRRAMDGGADGLDVVRQILTKASTLLKHSGTVWLEVDTTHPAVIQDLTSRGHYMGLQYVRTLLDFTSRPRFCVLQQKVLNT